MSHITKILLKIIMLRIRNKIKPEITEEQYGFVEDKGTSNAIYILRTLIERALEVRKDVYLCFIDYIKAFNRKTNERVLNEANKRGSLVRTIRIRQATFLGPVMRRGKLEHLVTTGKFEGKRSRGRQREKIMDGLATWLRPGKVSDILAAVKDRDLWRGMIANAYKQGT
ncbi:renin receptor-like [Plakobranchus ocellatus]|uniref:Renin receptor-like n=1 Tax=Plakobranchus ocellatus TaxID=259542 RepID=A0AAV3XVM6_9GAST|nr:renin receptor-like [Plakobranchus ocellatus]